jgi:hypothetical protein
MKKSVVATIAVDLVDGGVIGGLDADEQLLRQGQAGTGLAGKDFLQHCRRDLAAAAAAVGKGSESGFGHKILLAFGICVRRTIFAADQNTQPNFTRTACRTSLWISARNCSASSSR